ncbi:S8 family peptidase [Ichthyenterobacterium magnum]|uniref:Subtilase family protein n=1 Tax=Ichthyenterobacterium magnum TaxID=1230530 RepID=A0A420DX43_9FLAO|nr:S8 family peptidase [Ichthyenterobacterium magnum]RKE98779.1 subtilase family protein [Ichthyenterobacterium magnum]
MKHFTHKLLYIVLITSFLYNCGGASGLISTPIENIDTLPIKVSDLSENEEQNWIHLDFEKDTIPGISLDKTYNEIIKNKKGQTTIVAVIDSGIDTSHEDLDAVIWTNTKEIPNNNKDDDGNGYVDDIHGWNFLGNTTNEQLEYVRLLASGNTSHPRYAEAQAELASSIQRYTELKSRHENILKQIDDADKAVAQHLGKNTYTKEEVNAIKTEDNSLSESVQIIKLMLIDFRTIADVKDAINQNISLYSDRLNFHLNKNFKGKKTNDNKDDLTDVGYGNGNVNPSNPSRTHGTHVSGIIAAKRNNNRGIKGVANNVKIMCIKSTPNGDEYDKDVALGIRYAADNGAKVINMSFGKYYSPHSDWVRDAIAYAATKDVLIVTGSGNEGLNLDTTNNFPNDQINNGPEVSDNFLSVGALGPKYGANLVADYSNYGKTNVDIFSPGSKIYSSVPGNTYKFAQGTSMASPVVAGVAALIRSQYPSLKASQVKKIILDSGIPLKTKVVIPGDSGNIKAFNTLSKSGKMVNAYNALILAKQMVDRN